MAGQLERCQLSPQPFGCMAKRQLFHALDGGEQPLAALAFRPDRNHFGNLEQEIEHRLTLAKRHLRAERTFLVFDLAAQAGFFEQFPLYGLCQRFAFLHIAFGKGQGAFVAQAADKTDLYAIRRFAIGDSANLHNNPPSGMCFPFETCLL